MPFNGTGQFNRVRNWQADAAAGIKIRADLHDSEDDNLAGGLSSVICRDGQSQISADIPWNAKKITNLANPVNPQDASTKAYADSIRTFSTGIYLTGGSTGASPNFVSTAFVGFTEADMALVGRKADPAATPPTINRLTFNDKADGTGADVLTINEDGTISGLGVITRIVQRLVTATETWTKANYPGLKYLLVEGQASGGAGSGAAATAATGSSSAGGGGGSGAWGSRLFTAAELPATVLITIGGPGLGASGANGPAGAAITFGALASLNGGLGGTMGGPSTSAVNIAGGAGGTGTGWTISVPGGTGGWGSLNWLGNPGQNLLGGGAGSRYGPAGVWLPTTSFTGVNAIGYGSGGNAAASSGAGQGAKAGGNGAPGFIKLTEIY